MMIGTSLRQALSIRGKLLGTYIQYPAASVIEVLKLAGVDYVVLDLEHGQNSFHNIIEMVYASEACGMIPVVRVPGLDEAIIGRVLDLGVSAIKIPGVHSGKDAKNAVAYCKYPPIGVRGGCPGVRGNRYGTDPDCWQRSNEDIMICCLVESKDAVDNMEDIISTPGIDVVNVGVGDLSRSL